MDYKAFQMRLLLLGFSTGARKFTNKDFYTLDQSITVTVNIKTDEIRVFKPNPSKVKPKLIRRFYLFTSASKFLQELLNGN